jgi:hypothetical protein
MPQPREIASEAFAESIQGRERLWIQQNVSEVIESSFDMAHELFLRKQHEAGTSAIKEVFSELLGSTTDRNSMLQLLEEHFLDFDAFFLSLAQSRKARAGKTLEFFVGGLLEQLQYPFTPQPDLGGKPDFVLPSKEAYDQHAMECIVLTCKTKLRERWRQIVTEGTRGSRFYLATNDNEATHNALREMRGERITLIVPKILKDMNPIYRAESNVVSYEQFFQYHLDPQIEKWQALGMATRHPL